MDVFGTAMNRGHDRPRRATPHGGEVADSESLDGSLTLTAGGAVLERFGTGLDAKVLVLNKLYMAVRVVSARRAFTLLAKNLAEVIAVDSGSYTNHTFES